VMNKRSTSSEIGCIASASCIGLTDGSSWPIDGSIMGDCTSKLEEGMWKTSSSQFSYYRLTIEPKIEVCRLGVAVGSRQRTKTHFRGHCLSTVELQNFNLLIPEAFEWWIIMLSLRVRPLLCLMAFIFSLLNHYRRKLIGYQN
jgi:hypothetical protein